MDRKQIQRLLIIVFGLAFIGSTAFAIVEGLFASNTTTTNNAPPTQETSAIEQLKAEAQGYAKVLEREPENITALQGLLQTSLQTGDLSGAIAPLKKLIKLYPDNAELTDLLTKIEAEIAKQSTQTQTESKQPVTSKE
jgi:cytochrome c-type biogenesis protein CcmH/NrfG